MPQAGVEVEIDRSHHTTGFEAFQAFVVEGRGITLMPRLALGWRREALVAVPIVDGPSRHVRLALLARTYHSPAVQAMSEVLRREIAEKVSVGGLQPQPPPVAGRLLD
ncbi:MAG: hypothetical protein H0U84_09915 [Thermoleophilaceae bacterium]|nr:hypothetical protein [Thermoleophilaceae bacterium]